MTHTYVGDYSNSNYKKKVCLKRTALAVECKRSKIWPITLKSINKFVFLFVLWRLSSCVSVCKHPFRIFSPPCNLTYQDEAQKQYWPHNPLTRKNGIINCCVKGCKTVKKTTRILSKLPDPTGPRANPYLCIYSAKLWPLTRSWLIKCRLLHHPLEL